MTGTLFPYRWKTPRKAAYAHFHSRVDTEIAATTRVKCSTIHVMHQAYLRPLAIFGCWAFKGHRVWSGGSASSISWVLELERTPVAGLPPVSLTNDPDGLKSAEFIDVQSCQRHSGPLANGGTSRNSRHECTLPVNQCPWPVRQEPGYRVGHSSDSAYKANSEARFKRKLSYMWCIKGNAEVLNCAAHLSSLE